MNGYSVLTREDHSSPFQDHSIHCFPNHSILFLLQWSTQVLQAPKKTKTSCHLLIYQETSRGQERQKARTKHCWFQLLYRGNQAIKQLVKVTRARLRKIRWSCSLTIRLIRIYQVNCRVEIKCKIDRMNMHIK